MFLAKLVTILLSLKSVYYANAYIPAAPSNDTSLLVDSNDRLHLYWLPGATLTASVSRQLTANETTVDDYVGLTNRTTRIVPWTKYSKGILIHFSENLATVPPVKPNVSWIALINCDSNGTRYSMDDDIFTISRDHGAVAALLYSVKHSGCVINQEYLQNYEKVIDVYTTRDVQNARIIESNFNSDVVHSFDPKLMDQSAGDVQDLLDARLLVVVGGNIEEAIEAPPPPTEAIEVPTPTLSDLTPSETDLLAKRYLLNRQNANISRHFLGAVLAARNLTVGVAASSTSTPTSTPSARRDNTTTTSLAMIILYAITGIVTLMFLVVIISGAVRALRHPERYGPRAGVIHASGHQEEPQSRAGGITRAILDTFPIIKVGQDRSRGQDMEMGSPKDPSPKDDNGLKGDTIDTSMVNSDEPFEVGPDAVTRTNESEESLSHSADQGNLTSVGVTTSVENQVNEDEHENCPICVCEFENGQDIRILPCDRRHRFHQECIDPYLLAFSKLCPLCRFDLSKPEVDSPLSPSSTTVLTSEATPALEHEERTLQKRFRNYVDNIRAKRLRSQSQSV